MEFVRGIMKRILSIVCNLKSSRKERRFRKRYKDYNGDDAYDCGSCKFIWGIKSSDDMCKEPACLYTMNDIDIVYSREKNRYILSIETAYWFDTKEQEIEYLDSLLDAFTNYMNENELPLQEPYKFWMCNPSAELLEGDTIPEVYTNFRIFVEGYKTVHQPTHYKKGNKQ